MKGRNETEISTLELKRTLCRSVTTATAANRSVGVQGPTSNPAASSKTGSVTANPASATAQIRIGDACALHSRCNLAKLTA